MRLAVVGELKSGTWEGLLGASVNAAQETVRELELDLSGMAECEPSGLVPLTALLNKLRRQNFEVRTVGEISEEIGAHLAEMEFFRQIGTANPAVASPRRGRFVAISELHNAEVHDEVINQVSDLLDFEPDVTNASKKSFKELC